MKDMILCFYYGDDKRYNIINGVIDMLFCILASILCYTYGNAFISLFSIWFVCMAMFHAVYVAGILLLGIELVKIDGNIFARALRLVKK